MTHEELEEAIPLYAVGAIERPERQMLEAHLLSGCASCHAALKECQAVAAMLPFGLPSVAPPRTLKAKIMAARNPAPAPSEVAKQPNRPSLEPGEWMNHLFPPIAPAYSQPFRLALALVGVALVVGIGSFAWMYVSHIAEEQSKVEQLEASLQKESSQIIALRKDLTERERMVAQLRDELQERHNEVTELRDTVIRQEAELDDAKLQLAQRDTAARKGRAPQDELAALLRVPNIRAVSLTGSNMAKGASGVLLYDPRTQKVWLYAVNLPECPSGTTYQLWAIREKPVSVGTFHMDSGETAHLLVKRLPEFSSAKQFAISLEPSGGRPQPTGAIYLTGQL